MAPKKIRLQEVADAAGVAFITAWRALNAPHLVSDKTQKKVRSVCDELGYVPNMVARSLVSANSGVIGVIVPTLYDSIFADTVQGVADVVRPAGIELLVGLSDYDRDRELEIVRAFLGRRNDGLILTGRDHHETTHKLIEDGGLPVVEVWDVGDSSIDMQVGFSSYDMAHEVTSFLIGKGYRRIAFVSPSSRTRALERYRGYKDALDRHGLDCRAEFVVEAEPDLAGGAGALAALMAMDPAPDAVFFNGDTMAIGAHLDGIGRGIQFPTDVALVGVHDLDLSSHLTPGLSSVHIPRYEIGEKAARMLLSEISGEPPAQRKVDMGFTIVERETT